MATARSTSGASTSAKRSSASPKASRKTSTTQDATTLLRADHKKVSELFAQYEGTRSVARKRALVDDICLELTIHAQIEEEVFYPEVQIALKDKDIVAEARVEHASLKALIAQIKDREPDGEMFDAKVKVLSEYVKHHVKEEQNEMFPRVKKTNLDLNELGAKLGARKEELKASPPQLEAPSKSASSDAATV